MSKEFRHLEEQNESYFRHLATAWRLAFASFKAGVILFIHGLYPDVLETRGGDLITESANTVNTRRSHTE